MVDAHRTVGTVYGTTATLDDVMDLGSCVRIHDDGRLQFADNIDHPTVALFVGGIDSNVLLQDEYETEYSATEWVPQRGWTHQYNYKGPLMHDSEFVGGALADHVLSTPGYWVAVPADHYMPGEDCVSEGWVLLHKEDDER